MVSRHWLYFGGFAITGLLLVGTGLLGLLDALSVMAGGASYSEEFAVLAMLAEAREWVVLTLVLGLLATAFLAATVVSVLRHASLPRSDRLVALVERLEYRYPVLRQFDASQRVEPTTEDRKQRLKERYVAGEISDDAFEREMAQLMDDDSSDANANTTTNANANSNVNADAKTNSGSKSATSIDLED
ncbi:SHOCT domain-containing protein [Natrialba asiatica]|uniref:SHOCT domain-containing protein n=1 Tax=Natrialba asiatica (strain ATCC 700177 / DSM 12278 / JCM 9576 / FERM P-10747 / NBRC 102637 / 172P1) TaxID=29540 RepID=M0AQ78_NATA1|nr:SHOCT domain-containing protein [Natrialba asiatica]ELZ00083.1 hypothetical protein C481_13844 [Natrialba asiatica DSM 12278]